MSEVLTVPNQAGRFGAYGGRFVPETLMNALDELETAYQSAKVDPDFQQRFHSLLQQYVGRPSRLYFAPRLTNAAGGAQIFLKREDLNHTGAHKINNALGQVLLAKRMGKTRIIAETGAGMHGVATATASALLGLPCQVYMGAEDVRRQELNVFRMRAMGTEVIPVHSGSCTLRDAVNEAMRDWMATMKHTHYVIGSVIGPHPFPMMVRDFQAVIGEETKLQCWELLGKLPEMVIACVGGGSNAAGMFYPFIPHPEVQLLGVEAGGLGGLSGHHAASINFGQPGILHGTLSYILQDNDGQTAQVHSVSAGLDYPGVGPEHAYWHDLGRVKYCHVSDDAALSAFHECSRLEGILPALETAHALAETLRRASMMTAQESIVLCFSGRGDKDCAEVARLSSASTLGTVD